MKQTGNYLGFTSRKIHSLLGIIPLGLFLLEHLIANSTAILGEAAFSKTVDFLLSLPGLWVLELLLIFLPLIFHSIMGVIIVLQASNNPKNYPYLRNWMFYLQRISGLIIFGFLLFHLFTVKFSHSTGSLFETLHAQLSNPTILVFYALSLIAAAFHFCNGLWGFAINWGILTGTKAQKSFGTFTLVLFVVFNLFWFRAMFAFI